MSQFVTIVGSREAPAEVCEYMADLALGLRHLGIVVRTGDAGRGVDDCVRHPRKYMKIPHHLHTLSFTNDNLEVFTPADVQDDQAALSLAARYHGAWSRCSPTAKNLHARNCYQIAGLQLNNPSKVVICWTKDGCETHAQRSINTGGTGTAISVAQAMYHIPILNVYNWRSKDMVIDMLQKLLDI